MKRLYIFFRNKIANTTIYWKYRHLIKSDVWNIYLQDQDNPARKYIEILEKFNFRLIENKKSLRESPLNAARRLIFIKNA